MESSCLGQFALLDLSIRLRITCDAFLYQPITLSRAYQGKTMTLEEYEKLPAADQEHFLRCPDCREMFDLRSEEDVVLHLAHHKPPQRPAFRIRGPEGYLNSPNES